MIGTYVAEAVGSFIFFAVILTKGEPVMVAVGLLVGILVATIASQGHLNPCITGMVYMKGKMGGDEAIGYIAAQLAGAFMAIQWYSFYMSNPTNSQKLYKF
jgi:glycerol uptake facilitator-like aquaporin